MPACEMNRVSVKCNDECGWMRMRERRENRKKMREGDKEREGETEWRRMRVT